jgi:hypothetical protein
LRDEDLKDGLLGIIHELDLDGVKVTLASRCCFLAVLKTLPSEILSEIGYCLCVFLCVKESKKQKDTRRRQRDRETARQRDRETEKQDG